MVFDATLLNTQHYKVRIKGKVEQSKGKELCPPLHLGVVAIEKGDLGSPSTTVANLHIYLHVSITIYACLNKSWWQHPTRCQLYGHLPPITKTIQVRRTRHAGHCWRNKDELISDVLLWTPAYGQAKAGRPARTYIQQLCEDMGCSPEDLPEAMNDREKWRERVRDIHACGGT